MLISLFVFLANNFINNNIISQPIMLLILILHFWLPLLAGINMINYVINNKLLQLVIGVINVTNVNTYNVNIENNNYYNYEPLQTHVNFIFFTQLTTLL